MKAYGKLKNALASTGLYSLTNDSLINAEILAIGSAIDLFEKQLNRVLGKIFIHLADEETLIKKARPLGLESFPTDILKEILLIFLRRQNTGILKEDLITIFKLLGYTVTVSYDPDTPCFYIDYISDDYDDYKSDERVEKILNLIFIDKSLIYY